MSRIRRKYLREGDTESSGEVVGRGTSPDGIGLRFEPVRGRSADRRSVVGKSPLRPVKSRILPAVLVSVILRACRGVPGSLIVYACAPVRFSFLLSSGFRTSFRHAPQAPPRAARLRSAQAVHRRYWLRSGTERRRESSRSTRQNALLPHRRFLPCPTAASGRETKEKVRRTGRAMP